METLRFHLNTEGILPTWLAALWVVAVALMTGFGAISLALEGSLVAFVPLAMGILMIAIMYVMVRGLRDPDRNIVELTPHGLEVSASYGPFQSRPHMIPYGAIADVRDEVKHRFGWVAIWPHMGGSRHHTDIRLHRMIYVYSGWGHPAPLVKVLHLDIAERPRFVVALKEHLAMAGNPGAVQL